MGNCTGELVLQEPYEGDTCHRYVCAVCGQHVMVGAEQLEELGLPTEHALPDTEEQGG